MSNIREVKFGSPEPNSDVLEMMERWTERVRSGEVRAVAIAGVKQDGTISTEWRGLYQGWLHQMISALQILSHRVLTANLEPE